MTIMTTHEAETESRLRNELSDFSKRAFLRDLVSGTGGNMSVRIPGTDTVLITPSGVSLADVEPGINLLIRLDGTVLENPRNMVPSKETSFHLAVYQLRPDAGAIAHVHPPCATAYSALRKPLPLPTISGRVILKEVPAIETAMPGSAELRELVKEGIVRHPGVKALLMAEHGILALGPDIKTAFYIADLVESTAKVAFFEANLRKNNLGE